MSKMDWMVTSNGRDVAVSLGTDNLPWSMDLEETAHSLALINRYNGHTVRPFSVAAHSIGAMLIARALGYSKRTQLCVHLHDAHEALMGDIISPIKWQLGGEFKLLESTLEVRTWHHFGIFDDMQDDEVRAAVKRCDLIALATERKYLMRFDPAKNMPWPVIDGSPGRRDALPVPPIRPACEMQEIFQHVDWAVVFGGYSDWKFYRDNWTNWLNRLTYEIAEEDRSGKTATQ